MQSMHMRIRFMSLTCFCAIIMSACTTDTPTLPPTPTAIAPDVSYNEPTFTVEQGTIERFIEETVRAVPVESSQIGFGRSGIVQSIAVQPGQTVVAGDLIAELQQTEEQQALIDAQTALADAQLTLQTAEEINNRLIDSRREELTIAREALDELLPGGDKDVIAAAQKEYDTKVREARIASEDNQDEVDGAKQAISVATQDLIDTQYAYSKAYWHWDWVIRYGTDPVEPYIFVNGRWERNYLDEEGKRQYERAYFNAQVNLANAEKTVANSLRSSQRTSEDATTANQDAADAVRKARKALDDLLSGNDSSELRAARAAVTAAEAELETAMRNTLKAERAAVTAAQKVVDAAQSKVDAGRIIAPRDGVIAALTIQPGSQVSEFTPVIEIADPTRVEYATMLTSEQMKFLTEGQNVEIRPVDRPDVVLAAVIRRMPPPYGATGGSLNDVDQSTRFQVVSTPDYTVIAGESIGRMRVILERKENVLFLPPEAIRSFNKRSFVIVRNGEFEERVNITIGIQTDTQVEIVSGLKAGDVIVGQ
jgi:multidrug resistance efflux pump